jgi:hypothetical protein
VRGAPSNARPYRDSDGAPIDGSTLFANEDRDLLIRHLELAVHDLSAAGITVGFLVIGGDHLLKPDLHEQAAEPEAAGLSLLALVRRALMPAKDGPAKDGDERQTLNS